MIKINTISFETLTKVCKCLEYDNEDEWCTNSNNSKHNDYCSCKQELCPLLNSKNTDLNSFKRNLYKYNITSNPKEEGYVLAKNIEEAEEKFINNIDINIQEILNKKDLCKLFSKKILIKTYPEK